MDDYIKKMGYICTTEYIRKNKILPFTTTWMGPKIIMLSKISQWKKKKNHMISLMCNIKQKAKSNKLLDTDNSMEGEVLGGG